MRINYSGTDIGFFDIVYNLEGECHRMNIPTRFYPDKHVLLAGNTVLFHKNPECSDYIGDNYETIFTLVRKDNGK
jgi:hypothetical protein|nr:MAG TPA: hypothetical protein [Caudoviricetes sp.]